MYKLINKLTNEEHICSKIVIDGFDYYVSGEPIINNYFIANQKVHKCVRVDNNTTYPYITLNSKNEEIGHFHTWKTNIIATNNPSIDLPKVVDELSIAIQNSESLKNLAEGEYQVRKAYFLKGYNKSQESHPFSKEDMIEFGKFCIENNVCKEKNRYYQYRELLQIWKEQRIKTIYYN